MAMQDSTGPSCKRARVCYTKAREGIVWLTPKRVGKWLFKWLLHALVTAILLLVCHVALNGWPLFFTHPEIEDIQCVTATNSSTGETVQVDASTGDMEFEFTANLLGCLSYKPFSQGEGEPAYTLEYFLKDGSQFTIGINETSVFYQGTSHALKMEDFPFIAVESVLFQ